MVALIKNLTGGFSATAKVVDGTLILSLPDAVTPVVWRMELGHVKASAIEVREQDDGTFMLTLKTPKGDINDIAPYATRSKAVAALVAVSRAMEHAHGEINPAANDGTPRAKARTSGGQLAAGVIGLMLVVVLIALLMRLSPQMPQIDPAAGGMAAVGSSSPLGGLNPGNAPAGEAVSADDFLRSR
jgi:hypothetical protein